MEEGGVEEAHSDSVQGKGGRVEGEDQLRLWRGLEIVPSGRVVTLHEDATGEVAASGGDVDPTDGVLDVLALFGEVEELVDAVELDALVVDHAGDDGFEAKRCPGDESGQAQSTDGCCVEFRVFSWRAEHV